MPNPRLDAIVSLLDEVEGCISDHIGQATALVDEAEGLETLKSGHAQVEHLSELVAQTSELRAAIVRQRALLAELRIRMRALLTHSS
jgi:hypothetical protein